MTVRPTGCGEDVAPYALGALEPEEARRFERHLDDCELCRADLATLRPVVDTLPATADPVEPPPELRKRIMSVVEAEAKERRRTDRAPERRPWWRARLLPAAAAAAAAAVIAGVVLTGGGDDTRSIEAAVNPPGAQAALEMDDGRGTLVVEGMPSAPAGHVYQVWKQHRTGPPQPTDALFTPTSDGHASVAVPGSMDGVEQVLVSTEPEGGSRRPTTAARIVIRT
jgi:anti-sigma-K factor RskA